MKKIIIIIILGISINARVMADQADQLFQQANEAYTQENFQEAVNTYEQVLALGQESPELYYNLGNAYFKTNNIAKAILNYERAKKLAPTQADIDYNLRLANLRVVDYVEEPPKLFFEEWFENFFHGRSSGQWGVWALIFLFIALGGGVLLLFSNQRILKTIGFFGGIIALVASLTFLGFGLAKSNDEQNNKYAIILSKNAYVKSGPGSQNQDLFILHEGSKVAIQQRLGEWIEVKFADSQDGKVGWVTINAIEEI